VDLGHLADVDRHPILGTDHDLLDVGDVLDEPQSAHDSPRAARLDDVAADVTVAPHDGVDDHRDRDAVGAEALGIDVDLVLPHGAADAGHLRHARHRVELVADEPVLQRAQLAQRLAAALDGVPVDVADAGRVRAERRHHAGRQGLAEELEAFEHP
jgi:hypothetical protein